MSISAGLLIYSGVMPLIKTYVVMSLSVEPVACFHPLQVRRAGVRLRSRQAGHVSSRGIPRRVHHQHEHRSPCSHLRKHRPFFHAGERFSPRSLDYDGLRLPGARLHYGDHHTRALLRPSKFLARDRRPDGNEQLG